MVDRVTRLSTEVLKQHADKFTTDFAENKKILGQVAIIRSKSLKNEMAGYITKYIKQLNSKKTKQEEQEAVIEDEQETTINEEQEESEDSPQEILVENQSQETTQTEN